MGVLLPRLPKLMLLGVILLYPCVSPRASSQTSYWPARHWRTAQPESQGVDSGLLTAAIDQVMGQRLGVHSLLVIRHGYAILHADFYPYNSDTPHDLASVTKSITSALAGIAVGRGLLRMDQPLLSFFPDERPAKPDPRALRITVGDVVHMESGFDCGYLPGEQELERMKPAPDYVRFALSLPQRYDPGTHASYCSPEYHLLGSLVAAAAHQPELEFASRNLFGPLGIRTVIWAADAQGRSHGWGDSHLFPEDVAKIGYLYLHGGQWGGRQIVPRDWVAASIVPPPGGSGDRGGLGYLWHVVRLPQGTQFGGSGRGGQSLIVWPDLDAVVVIFAGGNPGQIAAAIRQAIQSDRPLAPNPEAYRRMLARAAQAAQEPQPEPASEMPALAAGISGVVYDFPVNPSRLAALSLEFPAPGEARVMVKYQGENLTLPVGLDGCYRRGPYGPFHLLAGAMGKWTSPNEFLLDLNFIANINHYTLRLRFEGDRLEMTADEASGLIRKGHVTGTRRAAAASRSPA
jgi:CubicO group peptidase (beta-lactamase class C family)